MSQSVTPLAEMHWIREQLRRAAETAAGRDLLDTLREYRQVLRQIDAMQRETGSKAASAGAGKLAALKAGRLDDAG